MRATKMWFALLLATLLGIPPQADAIDKRKLGPAPLVDVLPGYPGFPAMTTYRASFAGGQSDPFGGTNAVRITEDATAGQSHGEDLTSVLTVPAGKTWTAELYTKPGSSGTRTTDLWVTDGPITNGFQAEFNQNGTVAGTQNSGTGTVVASGCVPAPNGWFKCWVTGTIGSAATMEFGVQLAFGTSASYNGDGASNNLIYGPWVSAGTRVH